VSVGTVTEIIVCVR